MTGCGITLQNIWSEQIFVRDRLQQPVEQNRLLRGANYMPYIEVESGVQLFYEVRGTGKPILFVHGWTMSHDVWEYQIVQLAKKYQTIVVDLRGNGDSDKPWSTYSYDMYANDIRVLLEQLNIHDCTLVGWSLGGAIGAHYLARMGTGVSKFISVAGAIPYFVRTPLLPYGPKKSEVDAWIHAEKTVRPDFTKQFVDSMFAMPRGDYTNLWIWNICMKTSWHVAIRSLKTLRDTNILQLLPQIQVPSAVFHGRFDTVVPVQFGRFTAKQIPDCRLVQFNGSGHVPFLEESAKFNRELTRFIENEPAEGT